MPIGFQWFEKIITTLSNGCNAVSATRSCCEKYIQLFRNKSSRSSTSRALT